MPDGGFKGMLPDPDSEPRGRDAVCSDCGLRMLYCLGEPGDALRASALKCDLCSGLVLAGDWPFCRPGHPEDHAR